jgi:hypothetical protein
VNLTAPQSPKTAIAQEGPLPTPAHYEVAVFET